MGGLSGLSGLRGLSGLTARTVVASGFDPDAQAFFTAANITDATQRDAVNALAIGKKANGTWNKYQAIYPFVGGTALQHSFNLKNPAEFQITWGGSVVHNSSGVVGNATDAYGNTGFVPSISSTIGNNHLSLYSVIDRASSNGIDMGVLTNSPDSEWGFSLKDGPVMYPMLVGGVASFPSATNTDTRGWFVVSRNDTITVQAYKNGTQVLNGTQAQTILPNEPVALLAQRVSSGWSRHADITLALATIGANLTASEITADYTTVQAYQTTLGRQV